MTKDESKKARQSIAVVMDPYKITQLPEIDKELNEKINGAVKEILQVDIRLQSDPEVISAVRDFVMVEIVKTRVFQRILDGSDDNETERLFRACLNAQSALRDEIWGDVRGQKRKEEFAVEVQEIMTKHKIIAPKVKQHGDKREDTQESVQGEDDSPVNP